MEITRIPIWDNDLEEQVDNILKDHSSYMDDELFDSMDDQQLYQYAQELIDSHLDDEASLLDIDTEGQLIIIGTLQRWDGSYPVYQLGTQNIGEAIKTVPTIFNGDDSFQIYIEDGHLFVRQTGHDNPVNPSIMEIRELTEDYDELENDYVDTLMRHSTSVAPRCLKVFGVA